MNTERLFEKSHLTEQEIKTLLKSPKPFVSKSVDISGKRIKYGVISDSHIGHKCYDERVMDIAAHVFRREKVDFVLHGGDICEGHYESRRQGSIFELNIIGGDNQVEKAVSELEKITCPIYAITGNHCGNTFMKMSGFDIGVRLQERLKNFHYMGQQEGSIRLKSGQNILLSHPDGGTAYAISYKVQKIVEALEGGTKPAIMHVGHFHKAEYLFYRNIHVFQNACLERQTPFMRNNHIAAMVGFWTVDLTIGKRGIEIIAPKFYPFY